MLSNQVRALKRCRTSVEGREVHRGSEGFYVHEKCFRLNFRDH